MRTTFLSALVLTAALGACATAPAYGPAEGPGDYGYADQPIEDDRYRVSYRGKSLAAAEDGAIRRAADLAVANGYDWFTVVNRSAEGVGEPRRGGPTIGIGGSTGGWRSGAGVGVSLPLGGGGRQEAQVLLEVIMGDGRRPDGPQTYDARSVLSNVAGAI